MKTLKNSKLNIAELSDIHLGHPNTPTTHTLMCLNRAFYDNETTAELDWIILAGDVFDRQMSLSDENVYHIYNWIASFLRICKKHEIAVDVLEGTPSHDWKQSRMFELVNEECGIGADLRYVSELSIRHIESLGVDVLYIPDEWSGSCAETYKQVRLLMQRHQLEEVDFTIMHGCFPHQMPPHLHNRLDMHNPLHYLEITRHYVFVGHIHLQSQHRRILASGSFNRIAHGEESPKGHYRLTVRKEGDDSITFVKNAMAMQYLTVNAEGLSAEHVKKLLYPIVDRLRNALGAIRVLCHPHDEAIAVVDNCKSTHSHLLWQIKESKKHAHRDVLIHDHRQTVNQLSLHEGNLLSLLMARVHERHVNHATRCDKLLNEVMHRG